MIDDKTQHHQLPLPHADNLLSEDLPRLRDALTQIDAALHNESRARGEAIASEQQAREGALTAEVQERTEAINAEAEARTQAIQAVQRNMQTHVADEMKKLKTLIYAGL